MNLMNQDILNVRDLCVKFYLEDRIVPAVDAARILGMNDGRIMFGHILPNTLAPIIVMATLELPKAIVIEASLSFLGLGTQPPLPSWGVILDSGKGFIGMAPWISFFPGLMIMLVVMGFNLFGDALRDFLDPNL